MHSARWIVRESPARRFAVAKICLVALGIVPAGCGSEPAAPGAATSATRVSAGRPDAAIPPGESIWLADLPEQNAHVGYGGTFAKRAAYSGTILFEQVRPENALFVHPDSWLEYVLDGQFKAFYAGAAMNDTAGERTGQPVLFRVLGDDKLLWQSADLVSRGEMQVCVVDITGVDRLRLETSYDPDRPGDQSYAHSMWLDPRVTRSAAPPVYLEAFSTETSKRLQASRDYRAEVRKLFLAENFDKLEELAAEARASQELLEATPKLHRFYDSLTDRSNPTENVRQEWFDRLARWRSQHPDKITPWIVEATNRSLYAFDARGTNWSSNVRADRWKGYGDRLADVRQLLEQAEALGIDDPELYTRQIWAERNGGGNRERVDELVERVCDRAPGYFPAYQAAADFLLTRWYGQPGDLEAFADGLRQRLGGEAGELAFALTICEIFNDYDGAGELKGQGFPYEQLKPGMQLMLQKCGDNMGLVHFACRFACIMQDRELARQLFGLTGFAYWPNAWRGFDRFAVCQEWSNPQHPASEAALVIPAFSERVDGVAFLDGGRQVAAACAGNDEFSVFDAESGKRVADLRTPLAMSVAANPTRSEFALAGHRRDYRETADPVVAICTLKGDQIDLRNCGPRDLAVPSVSFARGGDFIATGGLEGSAAVWKWADDGEPRLFQLRKPIYSVAVSSDGKQLATADSDGTVRLIDVEAGKLLAEQPVPGGARVCFSAQDKLYVTAVTDYGVYDPDKKAFFWTDVKPARLNAVAVDPEGKLLALGTQAGEILLYDAATNTSLRELQGHYWWVNSLAFSPDGKRLASGGTDMTVQIWDVEKFLPK